MPSPITFSQVLSNIGTEAPIAGFAFERAVQGLLEALVTDPGTVIAQGGSASDKGWDFRVGASLMGLQAPVYVVVKFLSAYSARSVRELMSLRLPEDQGSRLLIVHGRPTRGADEIIKGLGTSEQASVAVWDYEVLDRMLAEKASIGAKMMDRLNSTPAQIVQTLTGEKKPDWRAARQHHVARLNNAWLDNHLTLFLGAGISAGAKLKNWSGLLNAMSGKAIGTSTGLEGDVLEQVVGRFVAAFQGSPLILARYLRAALSDKVMVEEVRRALYSDVGKEGVGTSPAYRELAKLCAPRRSGFGVQAIVNYNYDDLMARHLKEQGTSHCLLVDRKQDPAPDDLPIYHVHGFLPQDPKDELGTGIPASLVLSEDKYHLLYQDPYNWSNWVQLMFLSSTTCLIIGHSLTDPNFRRVLEISYAKLSASVALSPGVGAPAVEHYAIMLRMSASKFLAAVCPEPECPSVKRDSGRVGTEDVERFLTKHHETEESLYRELGINVVWVEDWSEIPDIVRAIGKPRQDRVG